MKPPTTALSLTNPWPWAILGPLEKRIENRVWRTHFRGRFFLHAAKGCRASDYDFAIAWMKTAGVNPLGLAPPSLKEIPRGGIVGIATLVGVIEPVMGKRASQLGSQVTIDTRAFKTSAGTLDLRWHMPEQYGFVLEDVVPTTFVPCSGALGFWRVPPALAARAMEAA